MYARLWIMRASPPPSSQVGEERLGFFQRRDCPFSANRREVVHEFVQRIAGFEVVDERVDGNTCSPEAGRATQDFRIADDHRLAFHEVPPSSSLPRTVNNGFASQAFRRLPLLTGG